jgi:TRAP-type C4-dicarboxylate transport system substrate-binding protein
VQPNGAHATEAIKNLIEGITDDVIKRANAAGGNQYDVQEQAELKKTFASLRLALAKTSAPEKQELLKKLEKIRK